AAQIDCELFRALVAILRLLFKALEDDLGQPARNCRIAALWRSRSFVQDVVDQRGQDAALKRPAAGSQFVQNRSRGINIAARIHLFTYELFRRHVGQGSRQAFGFTQTQGGRGVADRVQQFCQAEVQDLEAAIGSEAQVGGFEVAVQYAFVVRRHEALSQLNSPPNDFLLRH